MVFQKSKMSQSDTCIELLEKYELRKDFCGGLWRYSVRELVKDFTKSDDHLKLMKSRLEGKRGKNKAKISDNEIEGSILIFNPPDWRWQRSRAQEFDLTVERLLWHNKSPWHIFTVDTPPKQCEQVSGDGNCLFRSLSFWITGSEDSHITVRELLVHEFVRNPTVYLPLTSHSSVESYMRETGMHHEGIWGTEVEIFVAATLLNSPIAVFAAFGDRPLWQLFKPLDKPHASNRRHPRTPAESTTMLYLHNSSNHFEPVVEI